MKSINIKSHQLIALVVVTILLSACSGGGEEIAYNGVIYAEDNVAMAGYDLVSYKMDMEATKGKAEFKTTYKEVEFYFNRASYRDEFLRNPEKYLPAYGGFCGYNMATEGQRAKPSPTLFVIQGGELIFFYDDMELDKKNKAKWAVDRENLKQQADATWAKMK